MGGYTMKYNILLVCFLSFCLSGNVLASLNDGLVAYYPFDGNADDMSDNSNDGIEYGGVTYATGEVDPNVKTKNEVF